MYPAPDHVLHLLRSEYLRRLARFALIDDVPTPWGDEASPQGLNGSAAETSDD